MSDKTMFRRRFPIRFLILTLSTLFVFALTSLVCDIFPYALEPIGLSFIITVISSGILCSALNTIFRVEKASALSTYKVLVVLVVALYFLFRFLLSKIQYFPILIAVSVEWVLISILDSFFVANENFTESVTTFLSENGKESLSNYLREDAFTASKAENSLRSAKSVIFTIAIGFTFILLVAEFIKTDIKVTTFILAACFYLATLTCRSTIQIMADEQKYLAMELPEILAPSPRKFFLPFIIVTACVLVAFIFSNDAALLDLSWLFALLAFLANLFSRKTENLTTTIDEPFFPTDFIQEQPPINAIATQDESSTIPWDLIFKVLVVIAIVVAIFVLFVLPLISRKFRSFFSEKKFVTYFRSFIKHITQFFRTLFHRQKKMNYLKSQNALSFRKTIDEMLKSTFKSKEKRKEINRLTALFLRIIEYGGTLSVECLPHMAPAEYTSLLALQVPEKEDDLNTVGHLFEQALYAKELLTPSEVEEFTSDVKKITDCV